jgi:hypothetical protein
VAKKWAEIEANERYQSLAPSEKEEVRDEYWNHVLKPIVPEGEMEVAREKFMARSQFKESEGIFSILPNSIERGVRSGIQGLNVGQVALGINTPEEAAKDIAYQRDQMSRIEPPTETKRQLDNIAAAPDTFRGKGKAFLQNPTATLASIGEGVGGSAASIGAGIAGGVGGTLAAGPLGGAAGLVGGTFSAGLMNEASSSMMNYFERNGVDTSNPEQLTAAFADPELKMGAYEYGIKRGVPIAVLDAVSAGLGGKLMAGAKGMASAATRGAGEFAIQGGLGAGGEAVAQNVAGDKYDPGAILLEGLAEVPGSVGEISLGTYNARNRTAPSPTTPPPVPLPDEELYAEEPASPTLPDTAPAAAPAPRAEPILDSGEYTPADAGIQLPAGLPEVNLDHGMSPEALAAYPDVVSSAPTPKVIPSAPVPVQTFNDEIKQVLETDEPIQDIIDRTDFPDIQPDETIIGIRDGGEGTEVDGDSFAYLNNKTGTIRYPGEQPTGAAPLPATPAPFGADAAPSPTKITIAPRADELDIVGTRAAPVKVESANDLVLASRNAASSPLNDLPEPTEAQKEAGNYRKGHLNIQGLDIAIETPRGGVRSGTAPDGKTWEVKMPVDYGYIKRSEGADGDHVDVFIGPQPSSGRVFVVDQYNSETGDFDEHKVLMGFPSPRAGLDAYAASFSDGKAVNRVGGMKSFEPAEFKEWIKNGNTKSPVNPTIKPTPATTSTPSQSEGLNKTYAKIDAAIEASDADTLNNILGNLKNTNSRKYFTDKTGVKLPNGVTSTRNAISQWQYDKLEQSTKPAAAAPVKFEEATPGARIRLPRQGGDYEYEVVSNDGNEVVLRDDAGETTDPIEKTSSGWDIISTEGQIVEAPAPTSRPRYTVKKADIVPTRAGVVAVPIEDDQSQGYVMPVANVEGSDSRRPEEEEAQEPETTLSPARRQIVDNAISENNIPKLKAALASPSNPKSREYFTSITGVELPSDRKGSMAALDQWGREQYALGKKVAKERQEAADAFNDEYISSASAPTIESTQPQQSEETSAPTADIESLHTQFAERIAAGETFPSIQQARAAASRTIGAPVKPNTVEAKQVDEQIEMAYTKVARDIVRSETGVSTPQQIFSKLVDNYRSQPILGQRSSTSVENQAYSTPAPIAYLTSRLAGINESSTVLEPTVGNGALLIEANERNVSAYEIDPSRVAQFSRLYPGARINAGGNDFTALPTPTTRYDVVITNPPFGRVPMSESIGTAGAITNELDQIIVRRALKAMKDDGSAVLIMGSKKGLSRDLANLRDKYNTANARLFFKDLYDNYNVTDHFIVDGSLYKKQGAGYPIDIIVVRGRGKSQLALPGVKAPRIYTSFEQLSELLENGQTQSQTEAQQVLYPESDGRELSGDVDDNQTVSGQADEGDVSGLYAGAAGRTGKVDDRSRVQADRAADTVETPDQRRPRPVGVSTKDRLAESDNARLSPEGINREAPAGRDSGDAGLDADRAAGRSEGRTVRVDDGAGRSNNDGLTQPRAVLKSKDKPKVISDSLQAGYTPTSTGNSLELLIPTNMRDGSEAAVARVDAEVGGVDDYVTDKLGYSSTKEMKKYFSAEQIDAVALAIRNIESGTALVIADQTGTGKGRINAAVLRYARLQKKIPVFITKDASLMADMYRDLYAIGERDFKALITNQDITGKDVITTEFGADVRSLPPKKYEPAVAHLMAEGKLPEGYDYLFTAYSQLRPMGKRQNPRMALLERIAPDAIISLDESHEAGGTQAATGWGKKLTPEESKYSSTSAFARHLVKIAGGVMYSSATYSKNPSTFSLYSRTGIANAVDDIEKLPDVIAAGGVPLQQAIAAKLVEAGQLLRRERSYAGVNMELVEIESDLERADRVSAALKSIFDYDMSLDSTRSDIVDAMRGAGEARGMDNAIGKAGVDSTRFSSIMHNLVGQALVAQKIEGSADRAIEIAKSGKKPLIALTLTNESFISDYAASNGYSIGDEVKNLNFNTMLLRFLERTRRLTIKDSEGNTTYRQITDDELPDNLVREYNDIYAAIRNEDFGNSPISPIDYLHKRLRDAGLKTGELTGRGMILNYGADANTATFAKRESSPKIKKNSVRAFNSGEIDVLILNQAGATGESMHSSRDFKDQRPRHMLILQPDPNINTYQQMLGRIHRTGQVNLPSYEILISTIPVERRPAAALMKKMASLNANTTANKRGATTISKITDFMNRYGDEVAYDILNEEPGLKSLLDVTTSEDGSIEGMASKVTGRMAILPVKEQKRLLDLLESRYRDYIAFLDQRGENALEARVLDLQADTTGTYEVAPGTPDVPFQEPIIVEEVSVKRLGKPYTMQEIDGAVSESLGGRTAADAAKEIKQSYLDDTSPEVARLAQRLKNLESEKASPEDIQKAKLAHTVADRTSDKIVAFLETFRVGNIVTLKSDEGNQHGVVLDIRRDSSKSPIALSQFTIKIAVDDATREITLPLSKILTRHGDDKESRHDLTPSYMDKDALTDLFENKQKDVREKRHIVTGNIIGGVEKFSTSELSSGKIIFFTRADGEVTQGILMPQSFKPEKEIAKIALPLRDAAEGRKVVDKLGNGRITTLDDNVTIELDRQSGGYKITVTRRGRKYYTSKTLTKALGRDLFSRTGDYAQTFDQSQFADVYSAVQQLGGKWAIRNNQDTVRGWRGEKPSEVKLQRRTPANATPATAPAKKGLEITQVATWTKEKRKLADKMTALARQRFGDDVNIGFVDKLADSGGEVYGAYYPARNAAGAPEWWAVVSLSENNKNPIASLNHEGIHHLRRVRAIDDKTWAVLEAKAENDWIKRYNIKALYDKERWVEEAIAEAYADRARWNSMPQAVRIIFRKVQDFLSGIRALLGAANITTPEQILDKVSLSKFARVDRRNRIPASGVKYQRRQEAEPTTEPLDINISDRGVLQTLMDDRTTFVEGLRGATTRAAAMATVDAARIKLQDRFLMFDRVEREIERQLGMPLPESVQVYEGEQLMTGKIAYRLREIQQSYIEPIIDKIAALNKIHKDGVDRVGRYLHAMHAAERNAQIAKINPKYPNDGKAGNSGSGMTDDEAQVILNSAEKDGTAPALKEIAALARKMLDESLSARVKYGLIKQEVADTLRDTYKNYVPLRGSSEIGDLANDIGMRQGKGIDVRGKEIKRAMGRATPPAEILAHIFAVAEEAVIRGEKNALGIRLYNLVKQYPSNMWKIAKPKMVAYLNKELGIIEYAASAQNANMQLDEFTVGVKVNGVQKLIQLNDRRLASPMKNLSQKQILGLFRLVAVFSRYISAVNTRYNPDFVASNFFRDLQTALLNISGLNNVDAKKLAKGASKDIRKAWVAIWRADQGKSEGKGTEFDQYYKDFVSGGGKVDSYKIDDIDGRRTKLKREIKLRGDGAVAMTKRGAMMLFETIERLNDATEGAIRLAVYANARKQGVSNQEALLIAKNITVNFNKHGEAGPYINALYVFANASIQGSFRIMRAMRHPRTRKFAMGIVAMGFIEHMMNEMLSPEDDDGEKVYNKIPEYVKQKNLILIDPTGQLTRLFNGILPVAEIEGVQYIKIPTAYGYNFFHALGRNLAGVANDDIKGADGLVNIANSFKNSFNPIGGFDQFDLAGFAQAISPTITDPVFSVLTNRTFSGSKIQPEPGQYDKSPPPASELYFPNVSKTSKELARTLNYVTGGDSVMPGKVSISPEVFDYVAGEAVGAAGAFIGRLADATLKATTTGEKLFAGDVPLLRVVVGGNKPWQDVQAAYDRMREAEYLAGKHKEYLLSTDPKLQARGDDLMKKHQSVIALSFEPRGEAKGVMQLMRDQAKSLRNERLDVMNNGDLTLRARTAKIEDIQKREEALFTNFNRLYLAAIKADKERVQSSDE